MALLTYTIRVELSDEQDAEYDRQVELDNEMDHLDSLVDQIENTVMPDLDNVERRLKALGFVVEIEV